MNESVVYMNEKNIQGAFVLAIMFTVQALILVTSPANRTRDTFHPAKFETS